MNSRRLVLAVIGTLAIGNIATALEDKIIKPDYPDNIEAEYFIDVQKYIKLNNGVVGWVFSSRINSDVCHLVEKKETLWKIINDNYNIEDDILNYCRILAVYNNIEDFNLIHEDNIIKLPYQMYVNSSEKPIIRNNENDIIREKLIDELIEDSLKFLEPKEYFIKNQRLEV